MIFVKSKCGVAWYYKPWNSKDQRSWLSLRLLATDLHLVIMRKRGDRAENQIKPLWTNIAGLEERVNHCYKKGKNSSQMLLTGRRRWDSIHYCSSGNVWTPIASKEGRRKKKSLCSLGEGQKADLDLGN